MSKRIRIRKVLGFWEWYCPTCGDQHVFTEFPRALESANYHARTICWVYQLAG